MSRTAHHIKVISSVKELMPDELPSDDDDDRELDEVADGGFDEPVSTSPLALKEMDTLLAGFVREMEESFNNVRTEVTDGPAQRPITPERALSLPNLDPSSQTSGFCAFLLPEFSSPQSKHKCHLCAYEPRGADRWKASNLTRHLRVKHSLEPKVYYCTFPSCGSSFNRSDNLRSHQRDQGHAGDMTAQTSQRPWPSMLESEDGFRPPKRARTWET